MTDRTDVFLSYSHNDRDAAANLHAQLAKLGLSVFWDEKGIREGDLWLDRLQDAVDGCGAFVVLVGRDGVAWWIGAETQAALNRYFAPRDDAKRLPIFPILLAETQPDALPAFLRLFQATSWNGGDPLPDTLFDQIRNRLIVADTTTRFEGCPFVGLDAYGKDQAQLFFCRQKETLDALACLNTRNEPIVRWLEINGNSGCGKSSLMNAGLLPLVEKGWLWRRTGYERWTCIGPMVPGNDPVEMLAECLAKTAKKELGELVKMGELVAELKDGDDALRYWLRERKETDTAFLLAVDQFEELFTFANDQERGRFDRLLAGALEDDDCPLFVISTVRADFIHRFDDVTRLNEARNHRGKPWTLAPIGPDGLREIIEGPARLSSLDVSEVKGVILEQAANEPGALPLVENALEWLWNDKTNSRLSERRFHDAGGLVGILSHRADALLDALDKEGRKRALELLFQLVRVDPEGIRHARQRLPVAEAQGVAGGGEVGRDLLNRLAGYQVSGLTSGPVRLVTITDEGRWVDLIHETLIRIKGVDPEGKPQPYWPTLWTYIEKHKDRAWRREQLKRLASKWKDRKGLGRLFALVGWSSVFGFRGLAAPGSLEQRYLRWSKGTVLIQAVVLVTVLGVAAIFVESLVWIRGKNLPLDIALKRFAYNMGLPPPTPPLKPIPQGTFSMGSPTGEDGRSEDEGPQRSVMIQPFEIGEFEVTFDEWDACVADGGCDGHYPKEVWGRGTMPVIYVSWNHTKAYLEWLSEKEGANCRLPSEAEWEYAARAGAPTRYAFGDEITQKDANFSGNIGRTTAVGSYPENAWELRDMHGNVWEWVEDCWHDSYDGAPKDNSPWLGADGGDCNFRVLRGGSWNDTQDGARSANRGGDGPFDRLDKFGFRVVCSSPSLDTVR